MLFRSPRVACTVVVDSGAVWFRILWSLLSLLSKWPGEPGGPFTLLKEDRRSCLIHGKPQIANSCLMTKSMNFPDCCSWNLIAFSGLAVTDFWSMTEFVGVLPLGESFCSFRPEGIHVTLVHGFHCKVTLKIFSFFLSNQSLHLAQFNKLVDAKHGLFFWRDLHNIIQEI